MPARLRTLLLLAALSGAGGGVVQAADSVTVNAERRGDLFHLQAQAVVHAPPSVVWETLTDYAGQPAFIPGLARARILARDGERTTVEQSGQARFLFLTVPIEVTTEYTERPPVLLLRRVAGPLRHLQGRYDTELLAAEPPQVRLHWSGSIGLALELPRWIGEALVRQQVREQFEGMTREIERRAQAAQPPAARP